MNRTQDRVVLVDVDIPMLMRDQLQQRAGAISQALLAAERDVLSGQRSGRVYPVFSGSGARYQASAPGEPPAERTGALRFGWRPLVSAPASDGTEGVAVRAGITTDISYAIHFDPALQPYAPGNIAPRPFVVAILDAAQPAIDQVLAEPFLPARLG